MVSDSEFDIDRGALSFYLDPLRSWLRRGKYVLTFSISFLMHRNGAENRDNEEAVMAWIWILLFSNFYEIIILYNIVV